MSQVPPRLSFYPILVPAHCILRAITSPSLPLDLRLPKPGTCEACLFFHPYLVAQSMFSIKMRFLMNNLRSSTLQEDYGWLSFSPRVHTLGFYVYPLPLHPPSYSPIKPCQFQVKKITECMISPRGKSNRKQYYSFSIPVMSAVRVREIIVICWDASGNIRADNNSWFHPEFSKPLFASISSFNSCNCDETYKVSLSLFHWRGS